MPRKLQCSKTDHSNPKQIKAPTETHLRQRWIRPEPWWCHLSPSTLYSKQDTQRKSRSSRRLSWDTDRSVNHFCSTISSAFFSTHSRQISRLRLDSAEKVPCCRPVWGRDGGEEEEEEGVRGSAHLFLLCSNVWNTAKKIGRTLRLHLTQKVFTNNFFLLNQLNQFKYALVHCSIHFRYGPRTWLCCLLPACLAGSC